MLTHDLSNISVPQHVPILPKTQAFFGTCLLMTYLIYPRSTPHAATSKVLRSLLLGRIYHVGLTILRRIADYFVQNRRFFLQESQIFCTFGTPLPFVCSQTPGGFLADARLVLTQFSLRRYVRVVRDICGVFSVFFDARGYSAYDYSRPSRQRISV